MQLYETRPTWGSKGTWHGTRSEAHEKAKQTPVREAARVYLWEVPNGKADMISALNGGTPAMTMVGAWGLTPRAGLKDIEVDVAMRELEDDEPAPVRQAAREPDPRDQQPGESASAFWARLEREEAERKAGKSKPQQPTQDDLDAL